MNTLDPIVEEVRARGRALTKRLNDNPHEIFRALYQLEQTHPQKLVANVPYTKLRYKTELQRSKLYLAKSAIRLAPKDDTALQGQIKLALQNLRQALELDKAQGSKELLELAKQDANFSEFEALLREFGG